MQGPWNRALAFNPNWTFIRGTHLDKSILLTCSKLCDRRHLVSLLEITFPITKLLFQVSLAKVFVVLLMQCRERFQATVLAFRKKSHKQKYVHHTLGENMRDSKMLKASSVYCLSNCRACFMFIFKPRCHTFLENSRLDKFIHHSKAQFIHHSIAQFIHHSKPQWIILNCQVGGLTVYCVVCFHTASGYS